MSSPSRLEPFLENDANRLMETVDVGDRRGVMERALLLSTGFAPVLKQEAKVQIPRVRLGLSRATRLHRTRRDCDRAQSWWCTEAFLAARSGRVDVLRV